MNNCIIYVSILNKLESEDYVLDMLGNQKIRLNSHFVISVIRHYLCKGDAPRASCLLTSAPEDNSRLTISSLSVNLTLNLMLIFNSIFRIAD